MTTSSAPQILAEAGFEPLKANVTMRATPAFKARLAQVAAECGMTMSDYLRALAERGVELHEERENMIAAGLDPDAMEPEDELAARVEELDEEYVARVEADAAEARAAMAAAAPPPAPQERPDPRDCPHPPQHRHGPRCGRCGSMIGQVRTVGTSGRYLGRLT